MQGPICIAAFDPDCGCMLDVRKLVMSSPQYLEKTLGEWSVYGLLARVVLLEAYDPHKLSVSLLANQRCAKHSPTIHLRPADIWTWKRQVQQATQQNMELLDTVGVLLEIISAV